MSFCFEFENTLVDSGGQVFLLQIETLRTIKNFETDAGSKFDMCLVSRRAPRVVDAGKAFDQLLARLETVGLKSFFEPVSQRVTTLPDARAEGIEAILARRHAPAVFLRGRAGEPGPEENADATFRTTLRGSHSRRWRRDVPHMGAVCLGRASPE